MEFSVVEQLVLKHQTPVLFLSLNRLRETYRELASALPGVALYYAVKSNSNPEIINVLNNEDSCFDVCSNGEIDILKKCGITADRCIHTHPIKRDSDIRYALDYGVPIFVVDNEDELLKLLPYKDKLRVL
ncbi:MAG: hypothetical protein Q4F84_01820, partial [Fibrobacter sp.]|nr:hypothetical protein [Fibrobacter sp.]